MKVKHLGGLSKVKLKAKDSFVTERSIPVSTIHIILSNFSSIDVQGSCIYKDLNKQFVRRW